MNFNKMWFVYLKILFLCLYLIDNVHAYQRSSANSNYNLKSTSTYDKWRAYYLQKDNSRQLTTTSPPNTIRLRHSRYQSFDNVINRLDHMTTSTTTTVKSVPYKKLRDEDNYDFMADDNYDDQEYDDEVEEDEDNDWTINDRKEDDNVDEVIEDVNFENGYQAEEATEPPKSLTKFKWDNFGTRSKVEESRLRHMSRLSYEESPHNAAIQHYMRVKYHINCKNPHQKVISVQSEHPSPGKRYVPHCTLLHRCSEDTGCCATHNTRCGPIKQTLIYLYFYTTGVNNNGTTVEKLPFYNHTECSCIEKTSNSSNIETIVTETSSRMIRSGSNVKDSVFNNRCRCPEVYEPGYRSGCTCDCTNGEDDCDTMKKGYEYFSLKDRLCISNGDCGVPKCEYGVYLRTKGRCPRKQEKIKSYADISE